MNFDRAYELAVTFFRANIPAALWGHPGIGKSALGQKLADDHNMVFIDIRLGQIDPVDLNGFVHKDVDAGTFDYLPWARFPLENTPLPPILDAAGNLQYEDVAVAGGRIEQQVKRKKGWLIMFDEVNTAPRQNLAAAYKIFLDRMVGSYKLHPNCRLMMGGNLVGEGLAGALPSPLVSRVAHIIMTPELTPTVCKILGPSISAFLTNHPKFIYQETQEPNTPFPTLRTWDMANRYLAANPGPTVPLEALACIVGTSAAVSYVSFAQQEVELKSLISGIDLFPLERSQDLLEYLATDVTQLDKHLHRFPGEWATIAKVRSDSIKDGTAT